MQNINKNKCHSKLDLESHRFLKQQQGEILNQVQDDNMIMIKEHKQYEK